MDLTPTPTLRLADDLFGPLLRGEKRSAIRVGRRDIPVGPLTHQNTSGSVNVLVSVERVTHKTFGKLDGEDASAEGVESIDVLRGLLCRFYPDIQTDDDITVIGHSKPHYILGELPDSLLKDCIGHGYKISGQAFEDVYFPPV